MAKTTYQMACEVSYELGLDLSGRQVEQLSSFLAGFEESEKEQRRILAGGRKAAKEAGFELVRFASER